MGGEGGPLLCGGGQYWAGGVFGVPYGVDVGVELGDFDTVAGGAAVATFAPATAPRLTDARGLAFAHSFSSLNNPLIISRESLNDSADSRSRW